MVFLKELPMKNGIGKVKEYEMTETGFVIRINMKSTLLACNKLFVNNNNEISSNTFF